MGEAAENLTPVTSPALECFKPYEHFCKALLDELPTERDRLLLMRFYLDGVDKQQLCREIGLSPKHFDRVLMRARGRLRTIIERKAPHLALFPRAISIFLALAMTFTFWVRDFGSW